MRFDLVQHEDASEVVVPVRVAQDRATHAISIYVADVHVAWLSHADGGELGIRALGAREQKTLSRLGIPTQEHKGHTFLQVRLLENPVTA